MRVALGGIWHETNSFVAARTQLDDFRRFQLFAGAELLDEYTGSGTELGGVVAAAAGEGVEIVPLAYAAAVPGALVEREAYTTLRDEIVERAASVGDVDAVVLVLHGAMVAEGYESPEVDLVRELRRVRPNVPVSATLDLHANLDPELAHECLLLCGYDTYPHVDMAERGAEVLRLTIRALRDGPPETAHVKLPLLTVPQVQETSQLPMALVYEALHALEERDGSWTASALPGYPYSDVDRLGFSVYVAADEGAAERAEELAAAVWERRERFVPELVSPAEAMAALDGPTPVVLADVADNVGGGSPGNGLTLLRLLLERGGRDGAVVVWDPAAARAANEVRSDIVVLHGFDEDGDTSLELRGRVTPLGEVVYRRPGPYMRGQRVAMGNVAVVECDAGRVVVTERRVMPFDNEHLRIAGVFPEEERVLVVKGAVAWKAGFGRIAARALYVSTPGQCPSDLKGLHLRVEDRVFPLRRDVSRASHP